METSTLIAGMSALLVALIIWSAWNAWWKTAKVLIRMSNMFPLLQFFVQCFFVPVSHLSLSSPSRMFNLEFD
jgi:hypothetical protein